MRAQAFRGSFPGLGWLPAALTILALAWFGSASAWSQQWNGIDSNSWNFANNWNGNSVPNSSSANAVINSTVNNPVQLNSGVEVGTLSMGTGTSLDLNAGFTVAGGSIGNNGSITGNSELQLANNLTLSGTGTLTLASGQIGTNSVGYTLTNQSTINGYGLIGSNAGIDYQNLSLSNSGTINANSSGNVLTVGGTGGSITNTGTFEATSGGVLYLSTSAPINNSGGNITANGGTVDVGTKIQGGTLNTLGGGVMQTLGSATLDGSTQGAITLSDGSTYTGGNGTTTSIQGTLNLGTSAGSTLALTGNLQLVDNTTLSGPGNVTLTGGQIGTNSVGYTLTNESLIQGYGTVGSNAGSDYQNLSLNNTGTIDANSSGNILSIQGTGGTIVNSNTLEATNGGILYLATTAVIQNYGNITAGNGSTVDVSTTIAGGALNTTGTGVMQTLGSATLDGLNLGAITLSDGSTYTGGSGTTTSIQGVLNLGTSTGSTLALTGNLQLVDNTTLSGPGNVTLTGGQIGTNSVGYTLTNESLIQGYGTVGSNAGSDHQNLSLANSGTINANSSGNVLSIQGTGGSIVNTGTFEATQGGILYLATSAPINNQNGLIASIGSGSTVDVNTTIEGGTLTTSAGGVMQTSGSATLNGLTLGAITLSDGSTYTAGNNTTTSIEGALKLGTGTGSTLALTGNLQLINNTTLSGPGNVTLTGGQIGTNSTGYTLTNESLIQGYGTVGSNVGSDYQNLSLANSGTINANSSGNLLSIQGTGGSIVNTGTFEASQGGILYLATSAPINNQNGLIASIGSGSTVDVNTTIQGGTLTTSGGGVMQTFSSATLDGSTLGAITLSNGSTYTTSAGGLTSVVGGLNLGTSGAGSTLDLNGQVRLIGNTTIGGPGTVVMSGNGQIGTNSIGYTLTNQTTIEGSGVIGSNAGSLYQNLNVINNGTINANSNGNTLSIQGTGNVTNNNVLEATNGGTLNIELSNPLNNGSGTILASDPSTVDITNSTIQGGTLTTTGGGVIQMVGTSRLDGVSQGALTISDGSTVTSGPSAFTQVVGALNLGTITGSTLALSGQMQLVGNTTFSGPGSVTMSGDAQIGTNSIGYTLTNQSTIQGTGLLGSNSGALYDNGSVNNQGKIIANGGTLTVAETGGLTNSGTLQANSGSLLKVTTNLTNFSGNTLTGGSYNANGGTIQLNLPPNASGGEIVNDAANITLSGASASITDGAGISALSALASIAANSSLNILNGQQFVTDAALLTNNGTLTLGTNDSKVTVSDGSYDQNGVLKEEISGAGAGDFGVTDIAGTDDLGAGSTLDVDLVDGFSLADNTNYDLVIMFAGGVEGEFSNVDCPVNDTCTVNYAVPGEVILDLEGPVNTSSGATPEPGTFGLMLTGIVGLAAGIKARNRRVSLKK